VGEASFVHDQVAPEDGGEPDRESLRRLATEALVSRERVMQLLVRDAV
jgi:hypothetical protein